MDRPCSLSPNCAGPAISNRNDILRSALSKLKHLDKTGLVIYDSADMHAHGGYCDVFVGRISKKHLDPVYSKIIVEDQLETDSDIKIAIKRLRVHILNDQDFMKPFVKELRLWSKLRHENILALLGYLMEGDYPSILSEWMPYGTARRYVESKELSTYELLDMLTGIARGVNYLHEKNIVHSDLKADNILIGPYTEPLICDFGISRMLNSSLTFGGTTVGGGGIRGTIRWMAPELLTYDPEMKSNLHTKASDVWAFGMTVYELVTKSPPFAHIRVDAQVIHVVINGEIPLKARFDQYPKCPPSSRLSSSSLSSSSSSDSELARAADTKLTTSYIEDSVDQELPRRNSPDRIIDKIWEACLRSWEFSPDERIDIRKLLKYLESLKSMTGASDEVALITKRKGIYDAVESASHIKKKNYNRYPRYRVNTTIVTCTDHVSLDTPTPDPPVLSISSESESERNIPQEKSSRESSVASGKRVHFQDKPDIIQAEIMSDADVSESEAEPSDEHLSTDPEDSSEYFYSSDEGSIRKYPDHLGTTPLKVALISFASGPRMSGSGTKEQGGFDSEESTSSLSPFPTNHDHDSYEKVRKAANELKKAQKEVDDARHDLGIKCMIKGLSFTELSKAMQRVEDTETNLEKRKKEYEESSAYKNMLSRRWKLAKAT